MAGIQLEDESSLISKGLYRLVSDVIGPECIVKLRRQMLEVNDLIFNCDTSLPVQQITSGSRSEGFNFKSSDFDTMYVDKTSFICTNLIGSYLRNLKSSSLFYMENEECSPGFTLLQCLTCDLNNGTVYKALVRKGAHMYLSSKAIRETFLSSRSREVHGPCQTGSYGGVEFDQAYTLRCPVWPRQAASFVIRSLNSGWPSYDVLKDTCNGGCLFVPISSKQQTFSELIDLEWRISFSLAEKKLIYSMNHCQFLCYGLSKLFLNEVLKRYSPIDDLLCSYFMKTAVFWEIYECSQDWSMKTFLLKFLNVFLRLIRWVSDGYCPNFFIPENNMFYGKIFGENQRKLLSILRDLYSDGYWCLLRCPSLNKNLTTIIREPFIAQRLSYNEEDYVSVFDIEVNRLRVASIFELPIPTDDLRRITSVLPNTINLNTDSEVMVYTARLRVNQILQRYTESILISRTFQSRLCSINKKQYLTRNAAQTILLKARTHFCMNYFYYARNAYITGNYHQTIQILNFIKHKLQVQPCMYVWSLDRDIIMATRQQGIPYDALIKSFIMDNVQMESNTPIDELQRECHAQRKHREADLLEIPPFVFLNFLLILSYTRIGNNHSRNDILEELHTLLYHDDGYHIHINNKAISWEILRICQQICGHHQAAFKSYINALNEEYNYFKEATIARIYAQRLSYNEEDYVSVSDIEVNRLLVVFRFHQYVPSDDLRKITTILHNTLLINTDSEVMLCTVRLTVNGILQRYAESILESRNFQNRLCSINKKQYLTKRAAQTILLKAKAYFCINYLYYAKYTYITGNYHQTIEVLNFIKHRLQHQPYMYDWSLDKDIIMATRQQGMTYDTLIKSYIVSYVMMESNTSIDELQKECHAKRIHREADLLVIPPLVFLNFLLILSYTRIGDNDRCNDILEEIYTLLHHDAGYHILFVHKAISWEILGICQQICGHRQAAFQSFIHALNDVYNYFKEATIARIYSLSNPSYPGFMY